MGQCLLVSGIVFPYGKKLASISFAHAIGHAGLIGLMHLMHNNNGSSVHQNGLIWNKRDETISISGREYIQFWTQFSILILTVL